MCLLYARFLSTFFPPPPPPPKPVDDLPPAKVAIIGAGVGGCFAGKFLREKGGGKLDIRVFAKKGSEVGGRASVCHYDGHVYESGAFFIHPQHKYLADAAKEYGEWWGEIASKLVDIEEGAYKTNERH